MNTLTMLLPLLVLLSLFWRTDDKSDPQYAMSAADLALLEKETDAKVVSSPFINFQFQLFIKL